HCLQQFSLHQPQLILQLKSFPTRRSSDLRAQKEGKKNAKSTETAPAANQPSSEKRVSSNDIAKAPPMPDIKAPAPDLIDFFDSIDRKSTRLNSSHVAISYAVFCLKNNTTT